MTLKNQRKRAPPTPAALRPPTQRWLQTCFPLRACCSHCSTCPGLTCVSAKMGLEVGTFEVGLSAAREAANVVSPSGEVYLRGTVLARGNEQWGRGQGQQLGVPNSHDTGWASGRLGESALWQHQHHSSLRQGWAHEHRLGHGCSLG